MSGGYVMLIVVAVIVVFIIILFLIAYGVGLCRENDAIGIVWLFISLGIFGLVLGWAILYNAKNGMYLEQLKEKYELENEKEEIRQEQLKNLNLEENENKQIN